MTQGKFRDNVKTVIAVRAGLFTGGPAELGTYGLAITAAGYDRAAFIINVGTMMPLASAKFACKVYQSASYAGTYTYLSGGVISITSATNGRNKVYSIDVPVSSSKPFLKMLGTSTKGTNVSVICNLYGGTHRSPVTTQAYTTMTDV
jgi:hypothetical protein